MNCEYGHTACLNVDTVLVVCFLWISLNIGFRYRKKIRSFQEYAVDNRLSSKRTLTASIVATCYGGSVLSLAIENTYTNGLYFGLALVVGSFFALLLGKIFAPRMQNFMGHLSLAETMHHWYGPQARLVTALLGLLRGVAVLTLEFKVISKLIWVFFDSSSVWPTAIAALVVIAYSSFGGIRSIAATDVLQFVTFGLFVPLLFLFLCYRIEQPVEKLYTLFTQEPKFNLASIFRPNLEGLSLLFLTTTFLLPEMVPAQMQRLYMAKNPIQAKKAFVRTTYAALPLTLIMISIGALLFVDNPTLKIHEVLPYLKDQFGFPGFAALFCIAAMALVMSTADSDLHAASVLVAHDVYHTLHWNKISQLTLVRWTSLLLGCAGLVFSFAADDLFLLHLFGKAVWQPTLTVPIWLALFGFRTRPAALFLSILAGLATTLSWDFWMRWLGIAVYLPSMPVAMLVNAGALFLFHHLLPKLPDTGWVGIQNGSASEQQQQALTRWWKQLGSRCQAFFSNAYWMELFPRSARSFFCIGLYLLLHALVAFWYMDRGYFMPYIYWYMGVMAAGALLCAYPTLKSYGAQTSLPYRCVAWPITLYLLLFVSGKAFMVLGGYKPMVCFLFALNLIVALILLPGFVVSAMAALVLFLPNGTYGLPEVASWKLFCAHWSTDGTVSWVPLTLLGYLAIVLYYRALTKKLRQRLAQKELVQGTEHEALLEAIRHQQFYERQLPLGGRKALTNIEQELKAALQEPVLDQVRKTIALELAKLRGFKDFLLAKTYESQYNIELDKEHLRPIRVPTLAETVYQAIQALDLPIQLLIRTQTTAQELVVDAKKLYHLLVVNVVGLSKKVEEDSILVMTIADTKLKYSAKSNQNTHASERILPALAFHFTSENTQATIDPVYEVGIEGISSNFLKNLTVEELYRYESVRIVDAHGGHTFADANNRNMLYILPTNATNVIRNKTYKAEHVSIQIAETKESIDMERRLQHLLLQRTQIPEKTIQETIQFIKEVHGHVMRKSGDPYYTHPMAVTEILLQETEDPEALLAALLHDVVEDTQIPLHYLTAIYGPKIAGIVDGVTHLRNGIRRWTLSKEEAHHKVEEAIKQDVRVLLVKLADRLHNLYTLGCRSRQTQERICRETVHFYIPLALRAKVGIQTIVPELQRLCDAVLNQAPRRESANG